MANRKSRLVARLRSTFLANRKSSSDAVFVWGKQDLLAMLILRNGPPGLSEARGSPQHVNQNCRAPPCPHVYRWRMSRRQSERASRFQVEIEAGVRSAAVAFRDNHVEASVSTAVRLWWTSHVRGRRFTQLVRQAYDVTQARISLSAIERGDGGRRKAMPYFLAVLRDLVTNDAGSRHAEQVVGNE